MLFTTLTYFAIGVALGMLTSVPIGIANVAVVDAGLRVSRGRAIAIGAGGAIADTIHAAAAFAGVGPMLAQRPTLTPILFIVSGGIVAAYGTYAMRKTAQHQPTRPVRAKSGIAVGLFLTLLNPAALLAWIVVAGALVPGSVALGAAAAVGVGLGAFACFATLGHLASLGRNVFERRGTSLGRWVGAALLLLGLISVGRGLHYLLAQ